MSNLSFTINSKIIDKIHFDNNSEDLLKSKQIDKIIIEDESDDSFNSHYSNKSTKNKKNIIKQSIKKSLISKINGNVGDNELFLSKKKNINSSKFNKGTINNTRYIKKNILINKTKQILEKSYNDYQIALEKYYNDVLEWMNNLYNDNSKSIMQIKFRNITLNEDIFNTYNEIIAKYKLNKDIFNTKEFDIEDFHDNGRLFKIAKIMTNNLLEKLGYKLDVYKNGISKRYKINNITNGI
jgi:hypothetical protein